MHKRKPKTKPPRPGQGAVAGSKAIGAAGPLNRQQQSYTTPQREAQRPRKRRRKGPSGTAHQRYSFSVSDGQTAAGIVVSYDGKQWHAFAGGKYIGVFHSLRAASRALPRRGEP